MATIEAYDENDVYTCSCGGELFVAVTEMKTNGAVSYISNLDQCVQCGKLQ